MAPCSTLCTAHLCTNGLQGLVEEAPIASVTQHGWVGTWVVSLTLTSPVALAVAEVRSPVCL